MSHNMFVIYRETFPILALHAGVIFVTVSWKLLSWRMRQIDAVSIYTLHVCRS